MIINITKQFYLCLCIIIFTLLFSSCSHYYYTPPEANFLMLSEKGDIKVSGGTGYTAVEENRSSFQTGYSPIKHFGVAVNYMKIGQSKWPPSDLGNGIESRTLEGAIGVYNTKPTERLIKQKDGGSLIRKDKLTLDLYTGYGQIDLARRFSTGGRAKLNSQYYFLQGGVHFQGKLLGLSTTLRAVQLDFKDGEVLGEPVEESLTEIAKLENDPFSFVEFSTRLRIGGEKVKCFFSRNWMTDPRKDKEFKHSNSSWHIGLIVDVHEFFKKKE